MFIKNEGQAPREFSFSQQFLKKIVILVGCLGFLMLFLVFFGIYQIFQMSEMNQLRKTNQVITHEITRITRKVNEFENHLKDLISSEKKLRLTAGLYDLPKEIRMAGYGGTSIQNYEYLDFIQENTRESLISLSTRIDYLLSESKIEHQSLKDIEEKMKSSRDEIRFTPSIRPTMGIYSSRFGKRRSPFTDKIEFHPGLDIAAPKGIPVLAPADGIVTFSGVKTGYGNVVEVMHRNRFLTLYGHLLKSNVKIGQKISRYDVLGFVGNTGRSTNYHLHYEVRIRQGDGFIPVDPITYILD